MEDSVYVIAAVECVFGAHPDCIFERFKNLTSLMPNTQKT